MQKAASPMENPSIPIFAYVIPWIVFWVSFVFSLERNPNTGAVSINFIILILGILVAVFFFLALIPKRPVGFPKRPPGIPTRQCIYCGSPIPIDGYFCPYCGFDHHNK